MAMMLMLIWPTGQIFAQGSPYNWETAIYADDVWSYFLGVSHPSPVWHLAPFDDSGWPTGQGSVGYGDNDDNTIIQPVTSVFMRHEFTVTDKESLLGAVLHADYDDAFVAYLNGTEIARANIGEPGVMPLFFNLADGDHEAQLYQGGDPTAFFVSGNEVEQLLIEGVNVLAVQVHNWSSTSSDLTSNFFLSFALQQGDTQFGATPSWFSEPDFSSDLPLIMIDTDNDEIVDEPRIDAHMSIIDNGPGNRNYFIDPPNNYDGQISIEIRGASSQMFPKKNYGFETQDSQGENNNVSLLGMPEENDWVLHGPYSDKTLLRNVLAYEMGKRTGRYSPRTRLCELYINDDYRGVYVLTERIKQDNNRVDIAKLTENDIAGDELTGGYIFQIDRNATGDPDIGWTTPYTPWLNYVYDDPDGDDILQQQRNYISSTMLSFEAVMNGPDFDNPTIGYANWMDVGSFIDYFLINEISKDVDAFKLSTFIYKDKDSNDPRFNMGPIWDFNLGFGNFDFCNPNPQGWAYDFSQTCGSILPSWLFRMLEVDAVNDQMKCRWESLRMGTFHTDTLMHFIDSMSMVVDESRQRNFERWPVLGEWVWPNPQIGETFQDEVDYLKNWLQARLNWMDQNMPGTCLVSSTISLNEQVKIAAFPVPFSEKVWFDISGFEPLFSADRIEITDALGSKIAVIRPEALFWDGQRLNGTPASPGIYFYHYIHDGKSVFTGKLIKQ